jgi:DNA ligase-1
MISREGEEYDLPHIKSELKQLLKIYPDIKLDGELYIHGTKLQDIIHHLRTTKSTQLCYHVYDLAVENSKQWNRTNRIDHMRKVFNTFQYIKFVDTPLCQNINDITLFDTNIRKEGYEGSIIRTYQGDYDFGFRSNDLLKLKTTLSEDFIIVGHTIKDNSNNEDFVLICETSRGKTFEVKPHGTVEQRLTMLDNIDSLIGLKAQLEFFEYTKDMIPFHITSVVIRNYE